MPESARLCSVDGCDRKHYAKGMCRKHYNASLPRSVPRGPRPCGFEGCTNQRNGRVYCMAHESQLKAGKELQPLARRRRPVDGMKQCSDCDRWLPLSEFNKNKNSVCHICKSCKSVENRTLRYGISRDVVREMLHRACEICGDPNAPHHIDHCHTTGKVRGALCTNCNKALGLVHDDADILHKMIAYLERSKI